MTKSLAQVERDARNGVTKKNDATKSPHLLPYTTRKILEFDNKEYECSRFTYVKGVGLCDSHYALPAGRTPEEFNAMRQYAIDISSDVDVMTWFRDDMLKNAKTPAEATAYRSIEQFKAWCYTHRQHMRVFDWNDADDVSTIERCLNDVETLNRFGNEYREDKNGRNMPYGTAAWNFSLSASQRKAYAKALPEHRMKEFLDKSMSDGSDPFIPLTPEEFIAFNFNGEVQERGEEHYGDGRGRIAITVVRPKRKGKRKYKMSDVFLCSGDKDTLDELRKYIFDRNPQATLVFINNNCTYNGNEKRKDAVNTYFSITLDIDSPSQEQVVALLSAFSSEMKQMSFTGIDGKIPRPNCITTTCTGLHVVYTLAYPLHRSNPYHMATWQGLSILNQCLMNVFVRFCGKTDKEGKSKIDHLPLTQGFGLTGFPTKQRSEDFQNARDVQGERMETYNTYLVDARKTRIYDLLTYSTVMDAVYDMFETIIDDAPLCPRKSLKKSAPDGRTNHLETSMGLDMTSPERLRLSLFRHADEWSVRKVGKVDEELIDEYLLMALSWSLPEWIDTWLEDKTGHHAGKTQQMIRLKEKFPNWRHNQGVKKNGREDDVESIKEYAKVLGIDIDDVSSVPNPICKAWSKYPKVGDFHRFYHYQALVDTVMNGANGMYGHRYWSVFELARAGRACLVPLPVIFADAMRLMRHWDEYASAHGIPSFERDELESALTLGDSDKGKFFNWTMCYRIIACDMSLDTKHRNHYRRVRRNGGEYSANSSIPKIALAIDELGENAMVKDIAEYAHVNRKSVSRHRDEALKLLASWRAERTRREVRASSIIASLTRDDVSRSHDDVRRLGIIAFSPVSIIRRISSLMGRKSVEIGDGFRPVAVRRYNRTNPVPSVLTLESPISCLMSDISVIRTRWWRATLE